MPIRIEERFSVRAPVEAVWDYLIDPRQVVGCLPGAELTEVADERTFHGAVKVKVGTISVTYRGTVRLVEVDQGARRVRMSGEGREAAGAGQARMAMESRVTAGADGVAEVVVQAELEVVGKIVQLGRGMIEQVSHQLFEQFSACVRATVEARAGVPEVARASAAVLAERPRAEALHALPLLLHALWAWLLSLFRRPPGHGKAHGKA